MTRLQLVIAGLVAIALLGAYRLGAAPSSIEGADNHALHEGEGEAPTPPTNRISIPHAVRKNLGITFAKVERRHVSKTLRLPGVFELPPTARAEIPAPLPGRVRLAVEQFDKANAGDVLFRLDSPAWRRMKKELVDLELAIAETRAVLTEAKATKREWTIKAEVLRSRLDALTSLQKAGAGKAGEISELRTRLAELECCLLPAPAKHDPDAGDAGCTCPDCAGLEPAASAIDTEIDAKRVAHEAAMSRFRIALESAAAVLGMPPEALSASDKASGLPLWHRLDILDIRAEHAGQIDSVNLASGGWAEEGQEVLSLVDLGAISFRAMAFQSDLGAIEEGQSATIVPPQGGTTRLQRVMTGTLRFGLSGDPKERTIPVWVKPEKLRSWARPGVTAQLEVVLETTDAPELAIPASAVVRDGLRPVFFRRNPENRDEVIRVEADLGLNDGRWIAVQSGVVEGEQVVLDGAYELNLSQPGASEKGGHWHADGAFCAGDH